MLNLIQRLIEVLKEEEIIFCHWKSNINLDKAVCGYDDLDLLVASKDISRFESAVLSLDFKLASNDHITFPSVKHYYGLDLSTGEFVHLHVYYKIITGPSLIKSYAFNINNAILNNLMIDNTSGMPIPPQYVEFVIYIIRVMTKFSSLCEHLMLSRNFDLTLQEIEYLYNESDDEEIKSFLQSYFPSLEVTFIKKCISSIKAQRHIKLYFLGKRMRRMLNMHSRLNRFEQFGQMYFQVIYRVLNKLFYHKKKSFSNGGFMIAIVGSDATGKSTIVNELSKWLSKNFTTYTIHVGKPPSTILTFVPSLLIKITKSLRKKKTARTSIKSDATGLSLPIAVRLLALGYERMKLTRKFWRKSINGEVVICDRYPSQNIAVMDSQRMQPSKVKGLKKKLACCEERFYNSIPKPDVVFQLQVPVEIAIERNDLRNKIGKEDEEFIRQRHKENEGLTYSGESIYKIDTSQEYQEVIRQIKSILWQSM